MPDVKLIPLTEEQAAKLRARAEATLNPDHLAYIDEEWGDDAAATAKAESEFDLALADSYDNEGITVEEADQARRALESVEFVHEECPICGARASAVTKLRHFTERSPDHAS